MYFSDMHSLQEYSKYVSLPLPFHTPRGFLLLYLQIYLLIYLIINALAVHTTQIKIMWTWILLDFIIHTGPKTQ